MIKFIIKPLHFYGWEAWMDASGGKGMKDARIRITANRVYDAPGAVCTGIRTGFTAGKQRSLCPGIYRPDEYPLRVCRSAERNAGKLYSADALQPRIHQSGIPAADNRISAAKRISIPDERLSAAERISVHGKRLSAAKRISAAGGISVYYRELSAAGRISAAGNVFPGRIFTGAGRKRCL